MEREIYEKAKAILDEKEIILNALFVFQNLENSTIDPKSICFEWESGLSRRVELPHDVYEKLVTEIRFMLGERLKEVERKFKEL